MELKEMIQLAKKLDKEIKTEGWTIEVHTRVMALVAHLKNVKIPKSKVESK